MGLRAVSQTVNLPKGAVQNPGPQARKGGDQARGDQDWEKWFLCSQLHSLGEPQTPHFNPRGGSKGREPAPHLSRTPGLHERAMPGLGRQLRQAPSS